MSVRFRVLIDGQPLGAARGVGVDDQGIGTVAEQRLHQLVRPPGPITDRIFEITCVDVGEPVDMPVGSSASRPVGPSLRAEDLGV